MSSQNRNGSSFYTLLGYVMILLIIALITIFIGVSLYWSGFYRVLISVSADTFAKWSGLANPADFLVRDQRVSGTMAK